MLNNYHYVFMLGANINSLAQARAVGKQGIPIVAFVSNLERKEPAVFSKYFNKIFYFNSSFELCYRLIDEAKKLEKKPVILYSSDYFVSFLSKYLDIISEYCLFLIPHKELILKVSDKKTIYEHLINNKILTPKSFFPSLDEDIINISKTINFPCIVKPLDSIYFVFDKKNIIISNEDSLISLYRQNQSFLSKTIIQEIVPGDEGNIYQCTIYIDSDGRLSQSFTMRKIHQYPPDFGITTLGEYCENAYLLNLSLSILRNLQYTGFASIEFKKHPHNLDYYLIEINPRLPWYNQLFQSSRCNFPLAYYLDNIRVNGISSKSNFKINRRWIYFKNDLAAFIRNSSTMPNFSKISWINECLKANSFAYLDLKDPVPYIKANLDLFIFCLLKLAKKIKQFLQG